MNMDYEGAAEIERAWREGLTPDPLLTVSEWSDRHRMLSSKASAEPGRWRTSRTPYLKAIMDVYSVDENRAARRLTSRVRNCVATRSSAA